VDRGLTEHLSAEKARELYAQFIDAREREIISEIRTMCGAPAAAGALEPVAATSLMDEVAADFAEEEAGDEDPEALAA